MEKIDFSKNFNFDKKIQYYCFLNDEKIIINSFKKYEGPITLQYLENGGIISLFSNKVIVKVNNGFLEINLLIYKGVNMNSKEFIEKIGPKNLINHYFK